MESAILLGSWLERNLADSFDLQLALLIGSGLLAVALLVLSLTKWGQARPVWKCVILSVAAHILLMGYAYGTRLDVTAPQVVEQPEAIRINLVNEDEPILRETELGPENLEMLTEFPNEQFLPEVARLNRPAVDSDVVIDRETEKPDLGDATQQLDDLEPIALPKKSELSANDFEPSLTAPEKILEAEEIVVEPRSIQTQPDQVIPQLDLEREIGEMLERPELRGRAEHG